MDMMWYRRRGLMVTPHIESVTGSIASFNSDYSKIPVKRLICNIEPIQEGTGDPSPENIRPISGRSGLNVMQAGKNLIQHFIVNDITVLGLTLSLRDDGTILISGTPTNGSTAKILTRRTFNRGDIRLKAGTYTFKISSDNPYIYAQAVTYDNGTFYARSTDTPTKTIETDFDVRYLDIAISPNNGENVNVIIKPQLELGSVATDYEPYKGSTYSINWETEAGDVYGGTLDVVSGKLVVDMALNTLNGSESFSDNGRMPYGGMQVLYTPLPTKANDDPIIGSNMLSNIFTRTVSFDKPFFFCGRATNGNIYFNMPETVTTIQQVRDWFSANNTQVWYKLATPIEIQLAPQEVKTLLGTNNIWCDSGDVTVDYWKWGK